MSVKRGLEVQKNSLRKHLGSRVLTVKPDYSLSICCFEYGILGILGVDAECVIVPVEKICQKFLEQFEVTNHFTRIQSAGAQHAFDPACMAVGKPTLVRMFGQHMPVFDFKTFADAEAHGGKWAGLINSRAGSAH